MILIYSARISSRLKYVAGLIFDELLGIKANFTSNKEAFADYAGPRVCYGREISGQNVVHLPSHGFLMERGVHFFLPELDWRDGTPLLFPFRINGFDLEFDLFSAAFYMVSRYEEYLPHQKDHLGRFEASSSFAGKNGFLQQPVVNHYALLLRNVLKEKYPGLEFSQAGFFFLPTYDVDVAFAYRGRGMVRTFLGMGRQLWNMDFDGLARRFSVLFLGEKDPFDTYDFHLELSRLYSIRSAYFFLCGNYGPHDRNISVFSRLYEILIKKLGDYSHVGIHPSFASNHQPEFLAEELSRLSSILHHEILFSRQHYLKIDLPVTYQRLISHGITHDFSMGFASEPGFRAGICSPFYFYDLEVESVTPLRVTPITVMDGTLRDYLQLTPEQAGDVVFRLMEEVRKVGGVFVSLWHNDFLSEAAESGQWRQMYRDMFEKAANNHIKTYDPLSQAGNN